MAAFEIFTVLCKYLICNVKGSIRRAKAGAGELAQGLRAAAALAEDGVRFLTLLAPRSWLMTTNNSSSEGSNTFFWPPQVMHTDGTQTFMLIKHP